jgi:hypothetical protein
MKMIKIHVKDESKILEDFDKVWLLNTKLVHP